MRLLPIALVALGAFSARADDVLRPGNGLELTRVLRLGPNATYPLEARPLWVDSQGRLVVQNPIPLFQGGGALGTLACLGKPANADDVATSAGDLLPDQHGILAAGPASDEFLVLLPVAGAAGTFDVKSVACGRAPQAVGRYAFPAGLVPVDRGTMYTRDSAGNVLYPAQNGVGKLAVSPSLAASLLVPAAALGAAAGGAGFPSVHFVVALADGRAFIGVDKARPEMVLVERAADGTLTAHASAIIGEVPPASDLRLTQAAAFDAELDALVMDLAGVELGAGRASNALGVLPRGSTARWGAAQAPWPTFTQTLVGGVNGPYATDRVDLWRLRVDAATADFDRDGLRAADEALLGTSDVEADSDGDGIGDGAEVLHFKTDPRDAASRPAIPAVDDTILAQTFFAKKPPLPTDIVETGQITLDGAMLLREITAAGARINRVTGPGIVFPVIDPTRASCPILGNPADLAHCEEPAFRSPKVTRAELVGRVDGRGIAVVETTEGVSLVAIDKDSAHFVTDFRTPSLINTTWLTPMADVGSSGYLLTMVATSGRFVGLRRLDAAFRLAPSQQPYLTHYAPGPPGKHGFSLDQTITYLLEVYDPATGGGCGAGGTADHPVFVCDTPPPREPTPQVKGPFPTEWVPVIPAVEKGEVITFSAKRYAAVKSGIWDEHAQNILFPEEYENPSWVLWRTTPLGATFEWLLATDVVAHLSTADRAAVDAQPLGPITAMGASDDGLGLCLAEPAADRVWEITLDAVTRRLATIKLAGSGSACAYDEQGHLATLGGAPLAVHVDGKDLPVDGVTKPLGLFRLGGRWIVQADGETARCVGATTTDSHVTAVALSPAPGGLGYIGADGHGFLTTPDRFCAGEPPLDAMSAFADLDVWTSLHNPLFTFRSVEGLHGAMAIRPDGVAFLGASDITGSAGPNSEYIPRAFFWMFPEYRPLDPASRRKELDPMRLDAPVSGLASMHELQIRSAVVIPGADPARDWGWETRPGNAQRLPPDAPDAGSTPPPGGTPPSPPGCGCAGVDVAGFALLVLFVRRRR